MKTNRLFLGLAVFLCFSIPVWLPVACSKPAPVNQLKGFVKNGKVGFQDQNNKVVIEPQFEGFRSRVDYMFEPYTPAMDKITGKDIQGLAITFPDGLGQVQVAGKWGYIDTSGKFVINPVYDKAQPFYRGKAIVQMGGHWQIIDKTGSLLKETDYEDIDLDNWSEGFTTFKKNNLFGYIDADFKEAVGPQFSEANPFFRNLGRVAIGTGDDKRYGYLGRDGKFTINPQFTDADDFSDNLVPAAVGTGDEKKYGYIGMDGKFVVPLQFVYASPFFEGLAGVATSRNAIGSWNHYGFIGKDGKFVIEPQFDDVVGFQNGLAAVRVHADSNGMGGEWGFIDKTGKYVIKPQFQAVSGFSDGLAAFTMDKDSYDDKSLWGFIDGEGKVVVKPKFGPLPVFSVEDGKIMVRLNGKYLYVDKTGKEIPDTVGP